MPWIDSPFIKAPCSNKPDQFIDLLTIFCLFAVNIFLILLKIPSDGASHYCSFDSVKIFPTSGDIMLTIYIIFSWIELQSTILDKLFDISLRLSYWIMPYWSRILKIFLTTKCFDI